MTPLFRRAALLSLAGLASLASPARAGHHFRIVEVYAGSPAAPNAQYVVLQVPIGSEAFVQGYSIGVHDSLGVVLASFPFTTALPNAGSQARILVATTQATAFFGLASDLAMTPVIPPRGGRVCYESPGGRIDCVSWGSYTGPHAGSGVPMPGIPPGRAIARRLDTAGSATTFDIGDDTDASSVDFRTALPAPRNNAGQAGTIPPSACGNGVVEGIEACETHEAGCTATCAAGPLVGVDLAGAGGTFALDLAPNPSRVEVGIAFRLASAREAEVGVFDLRGRRVRDLARATFDAGPHRLAWDGLDDAGRAAPAGLYVVRVRTGEATRARTLVRLH